MKRAIPQTLLLNTYLSPVTSAWRETSPPIRTSLDVSSYSSFSLVYYEFGYLPPNPGCWSWEWNSPDSSSKERIEPLLFKQDHADPIRTIKLQQTSIVQARSCRSNPQSSSDKPLLSKQDHADPIRTIKLQQTSTVQASSCRSNPHNQAPTNRMVTDFIAPMQPYQ